MEVNKEQFRELIESGNIGSALNRLSDISHFLGEGALREQLDRIAGRFQEYQEGEDAGTAEAETLAAIKRDLHDLLDQLPEALSGEGAGRSGCFGILLSLASALAWLLS